MEEDEMLCTPPEIEEAARSATLSLLPKKSKERYLNAYERFNEWCKGKRAPVITEKVVLAYFAERSRELKSSTLWSEYSMVKSTLIANDHCDISKMAKLLAFLKRNSEGYRPKKAKIFTREQITKFLKEAPDTTYLMMKVRVPIYLIGAVLMKLFLKIYCR